MIAFSGSTLAMYINVKSFIGFQILSEFSSSDFVGIKKIFNKEVKIFSNLKKKKKYWEIHLCRIMLIIY